MITIPTISQLYNGIISDIETEYGTSIPVFGKVFLRILAAVQAAKLKLIYLVVGGVQKNIFIDTADPESSGGTLERFGRIKLGRNPFQAVAGQYTVEVTGTIGAVIPGTITTFKSNDDSLNPGKLFILDNDHTLVSSPDTILLRALESGIDSKLLIGDELTATAPIANVNKTATVTIETVQPLAPEEIEVYRGKGIDAYRLEPQGGSPSDFRLWSKDAQGVQQAYPFATSGVSAEVNLFIEATIADSTDGKGTPSAGLLSDVEDVVEFDPDITRPLEERGRRPLGVFQVHYLPVTPLDVDIVIDGFVGITAPIQTAIFDAIKAQLDLTRPFVAGADILEDKQDIFDVNTIISIILNVRPGSVFGTITLSVDGTPVSSYTFINGNIPYLNSISYT
jgi:hypothetical protein